MSVFTKFKQKFAETFDKSYKTEDSPEFQNRLKVVNENEKKIKTFLANVTAFIEQNSDKVLASKNIIDAMFVLYESTPYEASIRMVNVEMAEAQKEI